MAGATAGCAAFGTAARVRDGGRERALITTEFAARSCQPWRRRWFSITISMITRPMPVVASSASTSQRRKNRAQPIGRPSLRPTSCSFVAIMPGPAARTAYIHQTSTP